MIENIQSPLNYTGNKYRILDQIQKYFPKKIDTMIDLFCGGATVGLNTESNKTIFVDSNQRVVGLLKFLKKQKMDYLLVKCEEIINHYNLSYSYQHGYKVYRDTCSNRKDNNGLKEYNSKGYYLLRDDYNNLKNKNSNRAYLMLYILMVYAFNNDIRFNANGDFNLPIGKTDLNRMNVKKVEKYIERINSIDCDFVVSDFGEFFSKMILKENDFVYMDPPYLIGNAVYNSGWGVEAEQKLLALMDLFISKEVNFALSNVLEKVGKKNAYLEDWISRNRNKIIIADIDYNYKSSSYNKITRNASEKEVLITNKR